MIADFLKQHGTYCDDKYFKDITTLKMGGHIKHYVEPNSVDDLKEIVEYAKNNMILYKVVGNGSNLICGESEFDGIIINLKKLNSYEINGEEIYAEAGVMAPFLANVLAKNGLSCLEFASGIPGNIGGLSYMNAGAYKGEMADVIKEILVLKGGDFVWMKAEECDFAYRHSLFQSHPHWIIIAVKLEATYKPKEEIEELIADRLKRRQLTQPLDKASAGSCFRNPNNNYAWKLIDGVNYRGFCKNNVCVSEKHSNFIVNNGGGTAEDYLDIACQIIDKVKEKYGISLTMEVEKFNC